MDLHTKYNQYFTYILAFSSFFIASNAAFFSITGLAHLFSGSFWSVVIMASSLEVGKLVTASFLYRFWEKITLLMKCYLLLGTFILIGITSIGIFGYLSKAYQESSVELNMITTKLELYEEEVSRLEEDKTFMLTEMEDQISLLPPNYITAKRKVREEYMPVIRDLSVKISESKNKLGELKQELITTGIDVGPILYVAKIVHSDVDSIVKWLIFVLIIVFDPLAVSLVVATNIVLSDNKETIPSLKKEEPPVKDVSSAKKDQKPTKEDPSKVEKEEVNVKKRTKFLSY